MQHQGLLVLGLLEWYFAKPSPRFLPSRVVGLVVTVLDFARRLVVSVQQHSGCWCTAEPSSPLRSLTAEVAVGREATSSNRHYVKPVCIARTTFMGTNQSGRFFAPVLVTISMYVLCLQLSRFLHLSKFFPWLTSYAYTVPILYSAKQHDRTYMAISTSRCRRFSRNVGHVPPT